MRRNKTVVTEDDLVDMGELEEVTGLPWLINSETADMKLETGTLCILLRREPDRRLTMTVTTAQRQDDALLDSVGDIVTGLAKLFPLQPIPDLRDGNHQELGD
jgi:hypothetical protein